MADAKRWLGAVSYGKENGYPANAAELVQARIRDMGPIDGLEVRRREAGDGIEAYADSTVTAEQVKQVESVLWGFSLGFRLGRGDPS